MSNKFPGTIDHANLTLTVDTSTLTGAITSEYAFITSWELEMTRYYTSDLWIDVDNTLSPSIFFQGSNVMNVEAGYDSLFFHLEYQYSGDPSGTYSNGVGDYEVDVFITLISGDNDYLSTNDSAIGEFLDLTSSELSSSTFSVEYNYDSFSGTLGAGGISSVPEPSTCAALFGLATIGLVILRRNRKGIRN